MHIFDIATKTVKTKNWPHLPACTSALRWQEHYYCFHGHNFTRFHPVTGDVSGNYPKDARNYFMKCPGFGEFKKMRATFGSYLTILYKEQTQIHFDQSIYFQINVLSSVSHCRSWRKLYNPSMQGYQIRCHHH